MSIALRKVGSAALTLAMVVGSFAPVITPVAHAASDLQITCDNVSISGNIWTFSGTWSAIDYGGTSGQYDVGVASPTGTYVDDSSKDSPDTYVFTQGPGVDFGGQSNKDDMQGTWSNEVNFGSAPASVSAALYHQKTQGNEISADATCTFVLPPVAPTLSLVKTVVNNNGGTAVAADWTLSASGPTPISGQGGAVSGGAFTAGTYDLSESGGPAGYSASAWVCTGTGTQNDSDTVTLANGQNAVCTITNDDIAPTVTVTKTVSGGTAVAGDFSFLLDLFGTLVSGISTTTTAGNHALSEVAFPHYTGGSWGGDCNADGTISLALDQDANCTITNTYVPPTPGSITVIKNTVGANGSFNFTGDLGNFTLTTVGGTASTSFTGLTAGTFAINETVPAGWSQTGASCDNEDPISAVTIADEDAVTCTITNTATGADVSVVKSMDDNTPDNGQQVTFTLVASNAGPAAATSTTITDLLPAGLEYVSDNGSGSYATSTGVWTLGSLAAGATTSLQIVATVSASAGTSVTNTATSSADYNTQNDTSSVTFTVNTPAPAPTPTPSGGGGGGGGNGPISTILPNNAPGVVLGASTDECTEYLTSYIKYGRANDSAQVVKLQQFLNNFEANNLSVTGTYDQASLAAVHAFQAKYLGDVMGPWGASRSTGYVYITTKKKINEIYCHFTKQFPLTADQEAEIARYRAAGQAYTAPSSNSSSSNSGIGSGVTLPTVAPVAPAAPAAPATPAKDEDATIGGTPSSQTASPATALATQGNWWTNFWNWVFGK